MEPLTVVVVEEVVVALNSGKVVTPRHAETEPPKVWLTVAQIVYVVDGDKFQRLKLPNSPDDSQKPMAYDALWPSSPEP